MRQCCGGRTIGLLAVSLVLVLLASAADAQNAVKLRYGFQAGQQ